jgi:ABC-type nitrate/sulfonate/bicarbonate transport system substrate-binding protein
MVVPTASKVTRPEELKGAKIGVYPSSTNVIYARMMITRLFGSPDAAQIIQIDPSTQFQLLESGGIDALIGPDPMPATAVARKVGRVLLYSPDAHYVMDPMPVGCASFSRTFATAHPEAAKRVQRAMERAVDYLRDPTHHAEVLAIVARRTGIDEAVVSGLGDVDYWKLSEADPPAVQRLADLLEKEGVLSGHVNTAALLLSR